MPKCGDHLCSYPALPLDDRHACALCLIELHGLCGVFYQEHSIKYQNICNKCKKREQMEKRLKEKNQEKPTGIPKPQRQAISTPNMNNPRPPEEDDDSETTLGQSPMFQPKRSPRLAALNKQKVNEVAKAQQKADEVAKAPAPPGNKSSLPPFPPVTVLKERQVELSQLTEVIPATQLTEAVSLVSTSAQQKTHINAILKEVPKGMTVLNEPTTSSSECKLKEQYKCYYKDTEIVNCFKCSNSIHVLCGLNMIHRVAKEYPMYSDNEVAVPCGIRCYNNIIKDIKTKDEARKKKNVLWHNDNPSKPDSCSIKVLVRWMGEEGNYNRLKGGEGQKGETKQALAVEISNRIKEAGCVVNRDPKAILSKINELVRQYKEAIRVKNSTGQGNNQEMILKLCPFFAELDPILADRPSTKPLLTNKDPMLEDASFMDMLNDVRSGDEEDAVIDLLSSPSPINKKRKSTVSIVASSENSPTTAAEADSEVKKSKSNKGGRTPSVATAKSKKSIRAGATKTKKKTKEEEGLTQLATVMAQKVKLQVEKFRSVEEKQSLQSKFMIVEYRQKLRNMGAPEEEINLMFPLPSLPTSSITVRSSSTALPSSSVTHASSSTAVPTGNGTRANSTASLHLKANSAAIDAPMHGTPATASDDVLAFSSSSDSETNDSQ